MTDREQKQDATPLPSRCITKEELKTMKVRELKEELQQRKLPVYGNKKELITRLKAALVLQRDQEQTPSSKVNKKDDEDDEDDKDKRDEDDTDNDGDDEDVSNDVDSSSSEDDDDCETPLIRRRDKNKKTIILPFRDIEESLEKFSGDDIIEVRRWVEDFEEIAKTSNWTDAHKLTYAKRLLTGPAKRFVYTERCAGSWKKLKKALVKEFADEIDDVDIHERLSAERKHSNESYKAYVYRMSEIYCSPKWNKYSVTNQVYN